MSYKHIETFLFIMGRYAFFQETDFEYKFRFAVQPSSDMRSFGGIMKHNGSESGDLIHEWEKRDMEYIMEELNGLREWLDVEMPNFESYEKKLEGTQQLSLDLYTLLEKEGSQRHSEDIVVRFRLGCFIYHQLMYVDKLTVLYET